jgi:hypothetical protein
MPVRNNLDYYKNLNCGVTMYTLDIPPEKKEEIKKLVEINALAENRNYFYHFFRDNCSTRIRDIIDTAVDGQFKKQFENETSRLTLRQHVRVFTQVFPFTDWLFGFFMGQDNDRKITVWEAMFLPSVAADCINNFSYIDARGVSRKLVSDTEIIYRVRDGYPLPDTPPRRLAQSLAAGIIIALFLVMLFFVQARFPVTGRAAVGVTYSLFGLLSGAAGLLLFIVSFFTSHDYTFHNANLLFCNPLLLVAVPLGIKYAVSADNKKRIFAERSLRLLWTLSVTGIIVSALIKLLPVFRQENLPYQIFMLPVALVFSLGPSGFNKMTQRIFRSTAA